MQSEPEQTGERVYPGNYHHLRPLLYYHLSRYHFAKTLLRRDDRVIDAASGTGYGSFELASVADHVVGIDLSAPAVEYAKSHFSAGNIEFKKGNVEHLRELTEGRFDAVVSFETIEHLDDGAQDRFLESVCECLTDKGLFVVSTPNNLVYSGGGESNNPFHLCELRPEEFRSKLERHFEVVQLFGQRKFEGSTAKGLLLMVGHAVVSILKRKFSQIRMNGDVAQQVSDFEFASFGIERCEFLVAVCKRPRRV